MSSRIGRLLALVSCLGFVGALSCVQGSGHDDSGVGAVDAHSDVDAAIDPALVPGIASSMEAIAVAVSLGAPLAPDGDMLRRDLAPDAMAQTRTEHGFSGSSVVTPQTCATYAWSGLTASVTMVGCTLEATGIPVAGSASVTVATRPVSFTVAVTTLTVDTTTYDGHVTLTLNGTDATPMAPTLDVDLMITEAGTTTHLSATGLTVATTATSMTISGSFTFSSGGSTTSVAAMSLTWQMGQCLPSSGSASVMTGSLSGTLVFSSTTPSTGVVSVTVPPFPPSMQMLFTPCP